MGALRGSSEIATQTIVLIPCIRIAGSARTTVLLRIPPLGYTCSRMTDAKLKVVAVALLGVTFVVILWFQPFATSAQRAEASGRRLRPLLQSSPRLAQVGAVESTGGLIELKGSISSAIDASELMAVVKESKPSCDIEISVYVCPQGQPLDHADHVRGYYRPDGTSGMEISKHPYSTYVPVTEPSGRATQ